MRKLLAFVLALLFVFGSFGSVFAGSVTESERSPEPEKKETTEPTREVYSGTCGADRTWTLDTELLGGVWGYEVNWSLDPITGALNIFGSGVMPDVSWTFPVPWYDYIGSITSISISDGITRISYQAFDGCSSVTSVTIPNSVTEISDYAFQNCGSLESITIPGSVTSIGSYAFAYSGLTSVIIPDSVTSLGSFAFLGCYSLTTAAICPR